jgi:trehalose-phosphatase
MKYVFKDLPNIKNRLKKHNLALLLDFDLTLSPLAKNPNQAFLPKTTKDNLGKIAPQIPVVIITGRKLSDIKKKVNIKNILYIGNHGLEHSLNKKYEVVPLSIDTKNALLKAKKELIKICKIYPEIIFEDKKYSLALGYRLIKKNQIRPLECIFKKIQKEINHEGLLEARLDKKTFELFPLMKVNKGTASLLVLKKLKNKFHKKFTPIYIGDGQTDEDAFLSLKKNGITIRVGKKVKSSAKWYLNSQKEVNFFLKWLSSF